MILLLFLLFLNIFSITNCIDTTVCLRGRDEGLRCDESLWLTRYYYHQKMKVCQPFFGCQSNGNSFKTVLECRQKCQDVKRAEANVSRYELSQLCNATYTPNLKIDIEKCDKEKMCKNNYVCLNSTCCPKKEYVCSLQFDSGKEVEENKHEGRYAYNQAAKQCFRFSYFRSQGNFNNFRTCKDAVDYCKTN